MPDAKAAARTASNSPILRGLARLGFAVNGLLHALIGLIAIGIAVGTGSGEADQSGALTQLASAPGGAFVLWVVVVGLAALGLWLILGAFLFRAPDPKKRVSHIVKEVAKGLVYLAVAGTALTFAQGGTSNSASSASQASAGLLSTPGGQILAVVIGVAIAAIGVYFVVKGVTKKFTDDISVPAGPAGTATVFVGVLGYVAKGVVLVLVGVLFAVAAFAVDPGKATGIDGALRTLATLPLGMALLWIVGAGLIAYGVYCGVRALRARL
ncbi:DUF1206 domain-containing protein [Subtercola sp. PAMC28395]|uniref:DUF1206 domain-containing protein n=1 Tax=Subtercola sp. PAMC28395 TaxID=2846775 RepID=UPI001C0D14C4|nr:DUF1206 domain-containing protein [Subtercola sp. PAMC28395]QWT22713.1 DUF1206 domain-containing protein [Subtercola sp. PAMC28395]